MNPDCKTTYYNEKTRLETDDLKLPIWFKTNADPKYICYCSKVTEIEVINAILDENARSVKDVVNITGAMGYSDCLRNHPTGKCCSTEIKKLLDLYK